MDTTGFGNLPVIGALPRRDAAAKLREIGETEAADALDLSDKEIPLVFRGRNSNLWPFRSRAWQHTAHAFGFLAPSRSGAKVLPIRHVGEIEADESLRNGRLKVTLNRLRVADYPGSGSHRVLFDFYGRNQAGDNAEDLHFNAAYRVREGEQAPIVGYPIFVGLNVGSEGLAFHCHTVNVKNDTDQAFLEFLESDAFRTGLKLAEIAQPAIKPLSNMAMALTKALAKRHRNVSVQDFHLGLDFEGTAMGARLAVGDYIAVQIPETSERVWRWDDWVYEPASGAIVALDNREELIPYNYLVFGVSRYQQA